MELKAFRNRQEYEEWLRSEETYVKERAEAFAMKFGEDEVPVLIKMCEEEYIFLHNSTDLAWILGEMIVD